MAKITPFLWFDKNIEDAAKFYLSLFPNAKKLKEDRAKTAMGPFAAGEIITVTLELEGQRVVMLNGGPGHPHTEAFSFDVACKDQAEIDGYWSKILAAGGEEIACGWIKDQFGLRWQITPENIAELISKPKAMIAMMGMKKMDIAALEAAGCEG